MIKTFIHNINEIVKRDKEINYFIEQHKNNILGVFTNVQHDDIITTVIIK